MVGARALYRNEMQYGDVQRPKPGQSPKPKKKPGRYVAALGFTAIFAMISLFQFALLTENQLRIDKLSGDLKSICAQNERLGVEVAKLKSVARIEDIAKVKLNMIEPESHQIVYVNEF